MHLTRRLSLLRAFSRIPQPQLARNYPAPRNQQQHPQALAKPSTSPPPSTDVFSRFTPWATSTLTSPTLISVLIRNHETTPFLIQHALLTQISDPINAPLHIIDRDSTPTLDLTLFEPTSGLLFLWWLFNRRLPRLEADCLGRKLDLSEKEKERLSSKEKQQLHQHHRELREEFTTSLIDAWRLGYALRCPRFQNDLLRSCAKHLQAEEQLAARSPEPHGSYAISWARRAFDATADLTHGKELRDFAIDVAAKRVYDVGMNGWTLRPRERLELGGCAQFAAEVFGSLGGQIGTKGVEVEDLARVYMVEEEGGMIGGK